MLEPVAFCGCDAFVNQSANKNLDYCAHTLAVKLWLLLKYKPASEVKLHGGDYLQLMAEM